eukprot:TRINITY_DN4196_c0_g1_i15.p1 TRINITY_DN4196_c0_g1~~TRINITY_DN4196_c0_g1_i15.p1  ORF type:complete len:482 (-),score=116.47 TRINITY_DN4196_c0_g1_i15:218-1663(-)
MEELRQKILFNVEPKTVLGKRISGEGFLNLAQSCVEAINSGAVPDIKTTWESVARLENQRNHDKALQRYAEQMTSVLVSKPLEEKDLAQAHEKASQSSLSEFLSRSMGDSQPFINSLQTNFLSTLEKFKTVNREASLEFCSQVYENLYKAFVHESLVAKKFTQVFDLLEAWKELRNQYKQKALGPAKDQVLSDTTKVDDSFLQYFQQVSQEHQASLDKCHEIERQLRNDILHEKEEALKAQDLAWKQREELTAKYEQQMLRANDKLTKMMQDKHDLELEFNKAQLEIQGFLLTAKQRQEIEAKMTEMVNRMIQKNGVMDQEEDSADQEDKTRYRFKLKQKAYNAIAYLPVDMMTTGGTNSLTRLSDVMDQIFSEYDVLEAENDALHRSYQEMSQSHEALKAKYQQERSWRSESVTNCTKCHVPFTFWNRSHYCRSCGVIYCSNCCSNFVKFDRLTELHPPTDERKCDLCMVTYADRILKDG